MYIRIYYQSLASEGTNIGRGDGKLETQRIYSLGEEH